MQQIQDIYDQKSQANLEQVVKYPKYLHHQAVSKRPPESLEILHR